MLFQIQEASDEIGDSSSPIAAIPISFYAPEQVRGAVEVIHKYYDSIVINNKYFNSPLPANRQHKNNDSSRLQLNINVLFSSKQLPTFTSNTYVSFAVISSTMHKFTTQNMYECMTTSSGSSNINRVPSALLP